MMRGCHSRKPPHKKYAQAIPGAYAIQKADKAPCRLACPAGLNVQGYVQMVKQGKYKEALSIIMERSAAAGCSWDEFAPTGVKTPAGAAKSNNRSPSGI